MKRHDWQPKTPQDIVPVEGLKRGDNQLMKVDDAGSGATVIQTNQSAKAPWKYRCPGVPGWKCGHWHSYHEMHDVSGVPTEIVGNAQYLCTGCRSWLVRNNKISWAELMEYQGAPAEHVAWIEDKLSKNPYAMGKQRVLNKKDTANE